MGLTDVMTLHEEEVLTGTFYSRIPETPQDVGEKFHYDIVDESDKSYSRLLDNIKDDRAILTIKTDDKIDFNTTGYVVTQDGLFWQITGVLTKVINNTTKEALRMLKETVQTAKFIRLLNYDNPWELK